MNRSRLRLRIGVFACVFGLPVALWGQAESSAPVSNTMPTNSFGFNLPSNLGTLAYSLSGSEIFYTGYNNGLSNSTALSGNLAYLSRSQNDPFSMVYSGGYLYSRPGSPESSTFQDLALSQVLRTRSWVFVISDGVSYLPSAPTTGLSGVAGVGDVGVYPVQTGLGPAQDILTDYSRRVSNGLQGSASWQLTPSLDLEGSASWQVMDFIGATDPGLDIDSESGSFGPNFRIDARDSVGAEAYYSRTTFPDYSNYEIESDGVYFNFNRAWSRRLSTTFSFGPQSTHGTTVVPIPVQVTFAGSATVNYATRTTGFTAGYTRGVNAGSGVTFGALSDLVTFGMNRPLTRDWVLAANASYSRNVTLGSYPGVTPEYNAVYGGVQLSRRLTDTLSCYGSYTAEHQTVQNNVGINAFSGLNNIFGFGITFAPAPLIRGR